MIFKKDTLVVLSYDLFLGMNGAPLLVNKKAGRTG